ncbi:unnamed protein product [Amoebophrya sp. A120]|nr:unnamed protein product [Amoebophrya sp. A120]|eukprot:GSA120T00019402001.1
MMLWDNDKSRSSRPVEIKARKLNGRRVVCLRSTVKTRLHYLLCVFLALNGVIVSIIGDVSFAQHALATSRVVESGIWVIDLVAEQREQRRAAAAAQPSPCRKRTSFSAPRLDDGVDEVLAAVSQAANRLLDGGGGGGDADSMGAPASFFPAGEQIAEVRSPEHSSDLRPPRRTRPPRGPWRAFTSASRLNAIKRTEVVVDRKGISNSLPSGAAPPRANSAGETATTGQAVQPGEDDERPLSAMHVDALSPAVMLVQYHGLLVDNFLQLGAYHQDPVQVTQYPLRKDGETVVEFSQEFLLASAARGRIISSRRSEEDDLEQAHRGGEGGHKKCMEQESNLNRISDAAFPVAYLLEKLVRKKHAAKDDVKMHRSDDEDELFSLLNEELFTGLNGLGRNQDHSKLLTKQLNVWGSGASTAAPKSDDASCTEDYAERTGHLSRHQRTAATPVVPPRHSSRSLIVVSEIATELIRQKSMETARTQHTTDVRALQEARRWSAKTLAAGFGSMFVENYHRKVASVTEKVRLDGSSFDKDVEKMESTVVEARGADQTGVEAPGDGIRRSTSAGAAPIRSKALMSFLSRAYAKKFFYELLKNRGPSSRQNYAEESLRDAEEQQQGTNVPENPDLEHHGFAFGPTLKVHDISSAIQGRAESEELSNPYLGFVDWLIRQAEDGQQIDRAEEHQSAEVDEAVVSTTTSGPFAFGIDSTFAEKNKPASLVGRETKSLFLRLRPRWHAVDEERQLFVLKVPVRNRADVGRLVKAYLPENPAFFIFDKAFMFANAAIRTEQHERTAKLLEQFATELLLATPQKDHTTGGLAATVTDVGEGEDATRSSEMKHVAYKFIGKDNGKVLAFSPVLFHKAGKVTHYEEQQEKPAKAGAGESVSRAESPLKSRPRPAATETETSTSSFGETSTGNFPSPFDFGIKPNPPGQRSSVVLPVDEKQVSPPCSEVVSSKTAVSFERRLVLLNMQRLEELEREEAVPDLYEGQEKPEPPCTAAPAVADFASVTELVPAKRSRSSSRRSAPVAKRKRSSFSPAKIRKRSAKPKRSTNRAGLRR